MYTRKSEPCVFIRTMASVITAVCLVLITISLGIAGVYTVRTINTINTDEIHNIVTKLSTTVNSVHSVSKMLTSSAHGNILHQIPEIVSQVKPFMQQTPQITKQALKISNNFKDILTQITPIIEKIPIDKLTNIAKDIIPTLQAMPIISSDFHSSATDAYKTILQLQNILHSPLVLFIQNTTDDIQHTLQVFTKKIEEVPFERTINLLERHENILSDLSWIERLSAGLQDLSKSLDKLHFNVLLSEVQEWRNMSTHLSDIVHKISNFL